MNSVPIRQLTWATAAGLGLSLLSALPVGAHGFAEGGLAAGASHPLLGLDHLLLLIGVGAAGALLGSQLLLFALGGAVLGAVYGLQGGNLPAAEVLAALSVSGLGLLMLQPLRRRADTNRALTGSLVAAAVAIHAMLHGLEASGSPAWWLGALGASLAVAGASFAIVRRATPRLVLAVSVLLTLTGGLLALAPL
ncbi:HupE/UreJ family protein, partial [Aphanothece microscopica]